MKESVKTKTETVEIRFGSNCQGGDFEIASKLLNAFKLHWKFPNEKVKVKVEDGWITLDGILQWHYQKEAAKKFVSNFDGVKGVTNNIKIKFEATDEIEKKYLEDAHERILYSDTKHIRVQVSDHGTRLEDTVDSSQQNDEVESNRRNTNGYWIVDNELAY